MVPGILLWVRHQHSPLHDIRCPHSVCRKTGNYLAQRQSNKKYLRHYSAGSCIHEYDRPDEALQGVRSRVCIVITPAKGIKKQVLGGMLVCLGAITALLARTIGFELDIFYIVISLIGGCLFLYGTIQKKQHKNACTTESICRTTWQLIISSQKDSR